MISVTQFEAKSLDLDSMWLTWQVSDYAGELTDYDTFVERSESPYGPFQVIGGPLVDTYSFRDSSPALLHQWRELYYRLRIREVASQEEIYSPVTARVPKPDLTALEIARLKYIVLREHAGRRCYLFPVRTFGARCVCYDRVSRQRTRSSCVNCYDTSFLGGYLRPVEAFVQIIAPPKEEIETIPRREQVQNAEARLSSFPPVKPGDILVEAENLRWRVATVSDNERLRANIEQRIVLHRIPKGDIAYKLPLNVDLGTLEPTAPRNFTNPQHAGEGLSLESILSVFGYDPNSAS